MSPYPRFQFQLKGIFYHYLIFNNKNYNNATPYPTFRDK